MLPVLWVNISEGSSDGCGTCVAMRLKQVKVPVGCLKVPSCPSISSHLSKLTEVHTLLFTAAVGL